MTASLHRPSGVKARIPKGTIISGTFPGDDKVAGRTYVVDVRRVSSGYLPDAYDIGKGRNGRIATITWVGSGDYWHDAPLEDVEIIEGRVEDAMFRPFPLITRKDLEPYADLKSMTWEQRQELSLASLKAYDEA